VLPSFPIPLDIKRLLTAQKEDLLVTCIDLTFDPAPGNSYRYTTCFTDRHHTGLEQVLREGRQVIHDTLHPGPVGTVAREDKSTQAKFSVIKLKIDGCFLQLQRC